MCVIAVKYKNVELPKEEHLRACEYRNKDGIGVALLRADATEIMIKKDFVDIEVFIKWFYETVKKEDICIIHYRFATHGLKDVGNRHPFPVTQNKELLRKPELVCQMAVAHNGVLDYEHHPKYSDTQKFVLDILADETIKNNLANPKIRKLINNFVASDRLVVLQADGTMYFWGEWVKEGEIYYSNSSYKDTKIEYLGFASGFNKFADNKETKSFMDICDGCGKQKSVKVAEFNEQDDSGDFLYLCKSCRKQMKKGKLMLPGASETQITRNLEVNTILEDIQCENCYDWVPKKDICGYFGHKICPDCLNDLIQNTLAPRDNNGH
jgi:predicted glutamine amidotransferase